MSNEDNQNSIIWRRRLQLLQRLQKITIFNLVIAILVPVVCCVLLLSEVRKLHSEMEDMAARIDTLTQIATDQQKLLEQYMENDDIAETQGNAVTEQLEPDMLEPEDLTESEQETMAVTEEQQDASTVSEAQAAHKVYLTFDDGPSKNTEEILEIFEKYQVKATFFVVGKEDSVSKELLCDIVDAGHTIGLHSYSHDYSAIYESVEAFAADFQKQQDYVYEATGVKSTVYRFPGGSSNTISEIDMQEFADYLESQGVEYYDWNISSGDGGSNLVDVQSIVDNCTANIGNFSTSIILMHDSADKSTTLEALPIIIENILAMDDTVILPITEDTKPVHHLDVSSK